MFDFSQQITLSQTIPYSEHRNNQVHILHVLQGSFPKIRFLQMISEENFMAEKGIITNCLPKVGGLTGHYCRGIFVSK
jgi:hypothetical protein